MVKTLAFVLALAVCAVNLWTARPSAHETVAPQQPQSEASVADRAPVRSFPTALRRCVLYATFTRSNVRTKQTRKRFLFE